MSLEISMERPNHPSTGVMYYDKPTATIRVFTQGMWLVVAQDPAGNIVFRPEAPSPEPATGATVDEQLQARALAAVRALP